MFGLNAINPLLLWGGLAVASPILIHLLAKRRYKIVNWAAMDFLLDADKRNRRRVQLEHLILLLLRCLAVLLLALLVARPVIVQSSLAPVGLQQTQYERIIVLDDSPSMQAKLGPNTAFDQSKEAIVNFVEQLSRENPGDTLTLLLTSKPHLPSPNGKPLNEETVREVRKLLLGTGGDDKGIDISGQSAEIGNALDKVERLLTSTRGAANKVVYMWTDMRARDWDGSNQKDAAHAVLQRVAGKTTGTYLVNMSGQKFDNLTIEAIRPREKSLVEQRLTEFEVAVHNHGETEARNVRLLFSSGGVQLNRTIRSIPPGVTVNEPISFTFVETGPQRVTAELDVADQVKKDNTRYFAAQVQTGVRVLVVDGDPAPLPTRSYQSEVYYLVRALAPAGARRSGNVIKPVTVEEFEALPMKTIEKAQVIYLANVYSLSSQRYKELEEWVREGGGLVVSMGDKVPLHAAAIESDESARTPSRDALSGVMLSDPPASDPSGAEPGAAGEVEVTNPLWSTEGEGLVPLKLLGVRGDPSRQKSVSFANKETNHPVLRVFQEASSPLFMGVNVYQWWKVEVPDALLKAGQVSVLSVFDDTDSSPAIIEQPYGKGKVLIITTPIDEDWSNWAASFGFPALFLDLNEYLARKTAEEGTRPIGAQIEFDLDPSKYRTEAKLVPPNGDPISRRALTDEEGRTRLVFGGTGDPERIDRIGFYELKLQRQQGDGEQTQLFAVNLDASEGNLSPVNEKKLRTKLGDASVTIVDGMENLKEGGGEAKREYWRSMLLLLLVVLGLELTLGWYFGTRR